MSHSYELVFEGVKDPNPHTLQRVKAVLIGDLNLTIEQVKNLLSGDQTLILESQDSLLLNVPYELLKKSGAKVAIVEKNSSDISSVDVSLSTLALDDNYSEPLFPKVVQAERLIAAEIDDGFGDLTIDTSIQHPEPPPIHSAKPDGGDYELTVQVEEQLPLPSVQVSRNIPPPPLPKNEAADTSTFSFSIDEAPSVVKSPPEKIAIKEERLEPQSASPNTINNLELSLEEPIAVPPISPTPPAPPTIEKTQVSLAIKVEKPSFASELSLNEPEIESTPAPITHLLETSPETPIPPVHHGVAQEPEPPPLSSVSSTVVSKANEAIVAPAIKVETPVQESRDQKKSNGVLPLFLIGLVLLIAGNMIYKNVTDTSSRDEAIIGQSLQAALKPVSASSKTDRKTKKENLAPSETLFIPPTLFKQSTNTADNKSFSASLSYSDEHLSGTIEFSDTTAYVPDIERIRARLAPLPIISRIFIEVPEIPSDPIHHAFHWTGPAAINITVGELKTRRVGSAELRGTIEGDKFVGVIATALNIDNVIGEPIEVHTTAEGQITFRITKNIEASKDIVEVQAK
jgi:hypothetical protein